MDGKKIAEALRQIGAGFNSLADLMEVETKDAPPAAAPKAQPAAPAPEKKPEAPAAKKAPETNITFEDIRGKLAGKAAAGYKADVKDILKKHSLTCLSDIEKHPELFTEILAEAEAIGNG